MSVSMALFPQEPHKKRAKNSKRINSHKQRPTYNEREATSSHSDRSVATTMTGIFGKRNKVQPASPRDIRRWLLAASSCKDQPPCAQAARLNGQRSGVDRTAYPPHSRLSFVSHHAERISIASVKGVNRAILDRRAKLASKLSRRA